MHEPTPNQPHGSGCTTLPATANLEQATVAFGTLPEAIQDGTYLLCYDELPPNPTHEAPTCEWCSKAATNGQWYVVLPNQPDEPAVAYCAAQLELIQEATTPTTNGIHIIGGIPCPDMHCPLVHSNHNIGTPGCAHPDPHA